MSKAQYTPGPWIWDKDYCGLYSTSTDKIDWVLCYESYQGMWINANDSEEANARLIAAAPDLLEALIQCRSDLEGVHAVYGDPQNAREHCKGLIMADAAIAKAEGE